MIIAPQEYQFPEFKAEIRCAQASDAPILVDYLKTVSGETRFLRYEPDEIHFTLEQEEAFIRTHNDAPGSLLLLVFVDGEYAGNGSFNIPGPSRRNAHRAELGIALFQKFTGRGIGTLLMTKLIDTAKNAGFLQCELSVVSTNHTAIRLYEKLGFREWGRLPRANRYADGTASDDVFMVLDLKDWQPQPPSNLFHSAP